MKYIEQPTERTDTLKGEPTGLEIAVIGMAGRFPGARSIQEFWQNLRQSIESIAPLDDERLLAQGVSAETLADPDYVKVAGVIEDIDLFDAAFFGLSPREAEILDPQQRLFLETAVSALETAGYDAERYPGSIGVYGGAGMNGYLLNLYNSPAIRNSVSPYELFISNDKDFLTTRVSYKLNLRGPSVDVQTACSSSLVAVHMACQSLLSGECDMALAGGVAVSKQLGYRSQTGSIYSPDGHCRAFDAKAAGTVSGNGVGIVVLKRLEDALTDRDSIDAVIKGSAINNDGALKVSYTAPCVEAQAAVIQAAQAMAEVSSQSIRYVEAHGTGTALGDPIELAALTQAFSSGNAPRSSTCAIGSVKTNIGHLDAASGIASFIKTVLALKHKQIPASLHFQQPNPQIDFNNSPFYVNATLNDWPQGNVPRRAGVSSFGIGGTNAHVVLEEAPVVPRLETTQEPQLLILSAKTPAALDLAALNLSNYLETAYLNNAPLAPAAEISLADVAHTLQVGRKAFEYRRATICKTPAEAIQQLRGQSTHKATEQPSLIFLFPGQGSQSANMARDLYETQPVFKQTLNQCARILGDEFSLLETLYPHLSPSPPLPLSPLLTQTAQPTLFAIEYALAQLWLSYGLKPAAMLGHSIGEYVAACLAGVFDLETALKLVLLRGQLMQQMPSGAMLSVALSTEAIRPWLSDSITLAASNGPQLCAVSGSADDIAALQSRLTEQSISSRLLQTSHGFHSPLMEPMVEPFVEAVSQATLYPPTAPFISSVTGTWITADEATSPDYWGRQIRQTVRFSEGVSALLKLANSVFLEVGPGHALTTLARQHFSTESPTEQAGLAINSLPHPKSVNTDQVQLLTALGQLWSAGVAIDWEAFQGDRPIHRIPLPTYPFERKRYWVNFEGGLLSSPEVTSQTTALKPDLADWFYSPSWERCLPRLKPIEPTERPCWLIFLDETGIGQQLAQTIEQSGQDVFTVCQGNEFGQAGYRQFTLNPERPEGFRQLWEELALREMTPTEIVYLWPLQKEILPFVTLTTLLQTCAIAHSTMGDKQAAPLQITVVTEAVYDVVGNETLAPDQAAVQGLCQVVGQEYPTIGCRQVDWAIAQKTPQQLAQLLWNELRVDAPPAVVAYRGRHRWQQTYRPIKLTTTLVAGIRLREGGLYAIAGTPHQGLGKIWASQLVEHYQANVVLLEQTDAETLQAELKQAVEQFGPLAGVFVSSPTTNDRSAAPIALLQPHHWEYSYRTKPAVLKSLAITLSDHAPDFCCVQSSLSSIIGGIALAAYAGANHVVDTFVAQQNQTAPSPWFSINWDACTEDASAQNAQSGWGSTLADFALTKADVWQATECILTQAIPGQIIVSKGDLPSRHQKWIHATPQPNKLSATSSQQADRRTRQSDYSRPPLSTAYAAPRDDVEETIAAIWRDLLGLEKIGIHDSFFDLGGHSLLAIQVISRLREAFPVEIEMRNLLFESPTVAKIAAAIAEQLPPENDLSEMAALLAEVQTLSTEEVQAQLTGGDA